MHFWFLHQSAMEYSSLNFVGVLFCSFDYPPCGRFKLCVYFMKSISLCSFWSASGSATVIKTFFFVLDAISEFSQ